MSRCSGRDVLWAGVVAILLLLYISARFGDAAAALPSGELRADAAAAAPAVAASASPVAAPSAPAGECSDTELSATSAAFAVEVKRRHAAQAPRSRIGYTIGEWFATACATRRAPAASPTLLSHVYIMIMSGSVKRERAAGLRRTWAQHMPRTLMVGDVADAALDMVTLPEVFNKSSYSDAQQRSLRGLLEVVKRAPADLRWVMMVDDDTWLNPLELLRFLRPLEWRLPVVMGYLFEDPGISLYQWVGGGSGMLLSMPAAQIMAEQLYPACGAAKADYNDYTLGECCWTLGVPQVHSGDFDFQGKVLNTNNRENRITEALALVTVHKVYEAKMQELYDSWKARIKPAFDAFAEK